MSGSASSSWSAMCSFSLWMLVFTGPSSITSGQMSMMKRASEVPPVVESSPECPVRRLATCSTISASRPRRLRNGFAPSVHWIEKSSACLRRMLSTRSAGEAPLPSGGQRGVAALGGEAEMEIELHGPGPPVAGAGARVYVRDLEAGRRKALVALVPLRAHQLGQRRREQVDRILDELRIRDMSLDAAHQQLARERAAAPDLQGIAERVHRAWLADNAVVDPLAALPH